MISNKIRPFPNSVVSSQNSLKDYRGRLDAITQDDWDSLSLRLNLKEFLSEICVYIEKRPEHAENVAHYLMGKTDDLRIEADVHKIMELTELLPSLESHQKIMLYDLLQTHRYGVFGSKELCDKTIEKLKALAERLDYSLESKLRFWVNGTKDKPVPKEQREVRKKAVQYLKTQGLNMPEWLLDGRLLDGHLTAPPPIPKTLTSLVLTNNKIRSFDGFMDGLINKKEVLNNPALVIDLENNPISKDAIKAINCRAKVLCDRQKKSEKYEIYFGTEQIKKIGTVHNHNW